MAYSSNSLQIFGSNERCFCFDSIVVKAEQTNQNSSGRFVVTKEENDVPR